MGPDLSFLPAFPPTADGLLAIAFTLLAAGLAGQALARHTGLPRVTGYALVGLLLGVAGLGELLQPSLETFRLMLDLALALLLFELGSRVDTRWLRANPWLLAGSAAESLLCFGAVYGVMRWMDFGPGTAAAVAIVAMSSSPAVIMRVASECGARGQVTERLQLFAALNTLYAVLAAHLGVGLAHQGLRDDWVAALLHPLYLIVGSVLLAWLLAWAFRKLFRATHAQDEQAVIVLFGLLLGTLALLKLLQLPALAAPLLAGMLVKRQAPRPLLWPQHFGTAGAVLVVLLFLASGLSITPELVLGGGLAGLAVLAVRLAAKLAGALAFAGPSGLSPRQGLALGVALAPMSGVAFSISSDVTALFPELRAEAMAVALACAAVLDLLGPVLVQRALRAAGETAHPTQP